MSNNLFFDFILPITAALAVIIGLVYAMKKSMEYDDKIRQKLFEEINKIEAQNLSKKLKENTVVLGVKKPSSYNKKRKPQKA